MILIVSMIIIYIVTSKYTYNSVEMATMINGVDSLTQSARDEEIFSN